MKPRRAQVRQRDYYEAQTKGTAFCNPKITKAKASKKSFTIYLSVCCPNPFSGRRRPLFSPQKEIFFAALHLIRQAIKGNELSQKAFLFIKLSSKQRYR